MDKEIDIQIAWQVDLRIGQEITEAIMRLFEKQRDLTILVIAHRESTLEFCDRAVELIS